MTPPTILLVEDQAESRMMIESTLELAGCAVRLSHTFAADVSQRNLCVLKYRGSAFSENKAPLVIDADESHGRHRLQRQQQSGPRQCRRGKTLSRQTFLGRKIAQYGLASAAPQRQSAADVTASPPFP